MSANSSSNSIYETLWDNVRKKDKIVFNSILENLKKSNISLSMNTNTYRLGTKVIFCRSDQKNI